MSPASLSFGEGGGQKPLCAREQFFCSVCRASPLLLVLALVLLFKARNVAASEAPRLERRPSGLVKALISDHAGLRRFGGAARGSRRRKKLGTKAWRGKCERKGAFWGGGLFVCGAKQWRDVLLLLLIAMCIVRKLGARGWRSGGGEGVGRRKGETQAAAARRAAGGERRPPAPLAFRCKTPPLPNPQPHTLIDPK